MSTNTSQNLWYEYFMRDASHDWILVTLFGCRALWATVGILFNLSVIYITLISKDLRHSGNIFIALESFFGTILNLNYFISFIVAATGIKFVRYENCFPLLFPSALFGELAHITMLILGLDRLFSVKFPFWSKGKLWSIRFYAVGICAFGFYASTIFYLDFLRTKNLMVSCSTNEICQSEIGNIMRVNTITLSILLAIVYGLVWFIVFMAHSAAGVTENNKHLIKSLLTIIGLDLLCICLKSTILFLIKIFTTDRVLLTGLSNFFSFFTITVYSANAPVLFMISTLYRSKFKKHFAFLRKNQSTHQSQIISMQKFSTPLAS